MGWAATTTIISAPEAAAKRAWTTLQSNFESYREGECGSYELDAGLAMGKEAGAQTLSKTGPHCGYSDPLLEELSAMRHVGSKLGLFARGDIPSVASQPPDPRVQLLSADEDEGFHYWWMAPASALLESGGSTSAASQPGAISLACIKCGASVHLRGAQFCGTCGERLPSTSEDAGRTGLLVRLRRELGQAMQAVSYAQPGVRQVDGTSGMLFKHNGPHRRRADEYALPVRQQLATALDALSKPVAQPAQGNELSSSIKAARAALRAWDSRDDELEERRRGRDFGGAYGDDDPDDPDDDEDDCYGYGGGRVCFQFRDQGWCSYGSSCRYRHPRYPAGCRRDCLDCGFAVRQALKLCSEHLGEVEDALQIVWQPFVSDGEMIAAAAQREQVAGVAGFLTRAAALGHFVLINHDNEGC